MDYASLYNQLIGYWMTNQSHSIMKCPNIEACYTFNNKQGMG